MDFFQIFAFFFSELVFYFSLFNIKFFFWIERKFTKFLALKLTHFFRLFDLLCRTLFSATQGEKEASLSKKLSSNF